MPPLRQQSVIFPLFIGRDGGSDSKVVRNNLLESKNVVQTNQGAIAKRPGLGSAVASAFVATDRLVGFDEKTFLMNTGAWVDPATGTPYGGAAYRPLFDMAQSPLFSSILEQADTRRGIVWNSEGNLYERLYSTTARPADGLQTGATLGVGITSDVVRKAADDVWYTQTFGSGAISGGITDLIAVSGYRVCEPWDVVKVQYDGYDWFIVAYVNTSENISIQVVQKTLAGATVGTNTYTTTIDTGTYGIVDYAIGVTARDDEPFVHILFQRNTGSGATDTPSYIGYLKVAFTDGSQDFLDYAVKGAADHRVASFGFLNPTEAGTLSTGLMVWFATAQPTYVEGSTDIHTLLFASLVDTELSTYDEVAGATQTMPARSTLISHPFMFDSDPNGIYYLLRLGDGLRAEAWTSTDANGDTISQTHQIATVVLCRSRLIQNNNFFQIVSSVFSRGSVHPNVEAYNDEGTRNFSGALSRVWDLGTDERAFALYYGNPPVVTWVKLGYVPPNGSRIPSVLLTAGHRVFARGPLRGVGSADIYPYFHENDLSFTEGSGGSLTAESKYLYYIVPYFDGPAGTRIRGLPSPAYTVTLAAGETKVTLSAVGSTTRNRGEKINYEFEIYRSEADGDIPYYVGAWKRTAVYVDTAADADIAGNRVLYTYGYADFASHEAPPPMSDLVDHNGRLWGIPSDDPTRLWFTGARPSLGVGVQEGPTWSFNFTYRVGLIQPRRLLSFGGVLLVFTDSGVLSIPGQGPDASNQGSFGDLQRIVGAPGIKDPNSVVALESVALYKAKKGWYSIDRGFNFTYIGSQVEDYNSSVVLDAVARNDEQAQILLDDQTTCLLYDPELRTWDVWEYQQTLVGLAPYGSGLVAQVSTALYVDTGGAFDDGGTDYTMLVKTRWFNLEKFTGYQRLYEAALLGEYKDSHTVRIKVYYDYVETAVETVTLALTEDPAPYLLRFQPARGQCKAVRFDIEEVSPLATKESATWTGIQLKFGVEDEGQPLYTSEVTL